jgi:hypothetical protein
VVCPTDLRAEVEAAFAAESIDFGDASVTLEKSITIVDPAATKGLEFDSVVVAEPELIVESDPQGGRLLYVALTRATSSLTVVHHGAVLPGLEGDSATPPTDAGITSEAAVVEQAEPSRPDPSGEPPAAPRDNRIVTAIAQTIADEIRAVVQPEQYEQVLDALLNDLLGEGPRG